MPAKLSLTLFSVQVCSSSVVEARLSACWGYPGHTLCLNADHVTLSRDAGSGSSSSSADISWRGDRALLVRLLKNLRESYYVSGHGCAFAACFAAQLLAGLAHRLLECMLPADRVAVACSLMLRLG
jgi:hypothetical protein